MYKCTVVALLAWVAVSTATAQPANLILQHNPVYQDPQDPNLPNTEF
jgi:hypothetical protein